MLENNQQIGLFAAKPLTVTEFIRQTNIQLQNCTARIIGEVGRIDEKNGRV